MSNTRTVSIDILSSGSSIALSQPPMQAARWPAASTLVSSLIGSMLTTVTVVPRRETVFLSRAQQRVMDRALRRSVKIIA